MTHISTKEFQFECDQGGSVIVERIPRFLLKYGKTSVNQIMKELHLAPDVMRNIKIRNDY